MRRDKCRACSEAALEANRGCSTLRVEKGEQDAWQQITCRALPFCLVANVRNGSKADIPQRRPREETALLPFPTSVWFVRKERRFELDTGERAEAVDDNTFALLTTGERLLRVSS